MIPLQHRKASKSNSENASFFPCLYSFHLPLFTIISWGSYCAHLLLRPTIVHNDHEQQARLFLCTHGILFCFSGKAGWTPGSFLLV